MSRESFCDALRGGARTDKQPVQSPVISLALIGLLRTLPSLGRPDMTFGRALVRASAGLCHQRAKDCSISSVHVHRLREIRRCASPPAVRASRNGIWYNAALLPSGVGESGRLDVVATPISHPPIDGRRQANLSLLKGRRHRTEGQTGLGEPPAACRFRQLHRRFRPCF